MSELKTITVGGTTYTLPEGAPVFIGEQADWDVLTAQEKAVYSEENGGIVIITNDYEVQAKIDDTTPSLSSVYSSQKTQTELNKKVGWNEAGRSVKKNLLPNNAVSLTVNGVTFTANSDGTITANGTASGNAYYLLNELPLDLEGVEYTFNGCPSGGSSQSYELQIRSNEPDPSQWQMAIDHGNGISFTASSTRKYLVFCGVIDGQTVSNLVFKPMLRLASISDDTYEPYILDNVELKEQIDTKANSTEVIKWSEAERSVKKNLLQYDLSSLKSLNTGGTWSGNVYTLNGVTFTVNDDLSITIDGTSSAETAFSLYVDNSNSCPYIGYILNGCPSGGSDSTYDLRISDVTTNSNKDFGNGVTISISTTGKWNCKIVIRNGQTVSNKTFYPMIRLASILDDTYTPYIPDNVELQEQIDGKLEESANNVLGAKNLLPNTFSDYSNYGIDITVADDGSLTVDGTCTTSFSIKTECNYMLLKAGTYVLSLGNDISSITSGNGSFNLRGKPVGGSDSTFVSFNFNTDNSKQFTIDSDYLIRDAYFNINSGLVFDETVFYPMIRPASVKDDTYVPYAKTNKQLTDDVTPSILSATKNNDYVGTNNVIFRKYGKVVIIEGYFEITSEAARDAILYSLSEKPLVSTTYYVIAMKTDGTTILLKIDAASKLKVESSNGMSAGYYSLSGSFLLE